MSMHIGEEKNVPEASIMNLNTECAYKRDSSAPFLDPCGQSNSNIMAVGSTDHSPEEFLILYMFHTTKYDE